MRETTNTKNLPKGITQRKDGRYMGRFQYEGQRYTLYDENVDMLLTRIITVKPHKQGGCRVTAFAVPGMYYEKVYSGTVGLEGYKTAYFRRFLGFKVYSGYRNLMESGVKVVYRGVK